MSLFIPIACSLLFGCAWGFASFSLEFRIPLTGLRISTLLVCLGIAAILFPVAALAGYFVLIRHALEGEWDATVQIALQSTLLILALLTHVIARFTSRRIGILFVAASIFCYAATYLTFITSPIDMELASTSRYWIEVDRLQFFWFPAAMIGMLCGMGIAALSRKSVPPN